MIETSTLLKSQVDSNWVDYNGHMNDAAYALVFSKAVDQLMIDIGLDEAAREKLSYTIYTLETHLCYLKEAHEGEMLNISLQLLDRDPKRLHVFFVMKNAAGEKIATSEQMLMGMNSEENRPVPFPEPIEEKIKELPQGLSEWPKEAGRKIGIRKKQ
ncbi:thioesterase family protein [Alteribacillus iranensis]|uniref:Acyl-CoA thioester hydrolase n=1 Tax=Alteribacillus iranensis TaxID=930128 RepID=A0A1I2DPR6_9BACI|nr:thioesterase family protein [Alteribacillus iranensis]SFE81930.1 acyl-CoA thioester hydrolase [Alteribacillus iranensis]